MNSSTLVTVLLITYNHLNTFERAIESVLKQKTNFKIQVIVLDDASKDGTSELVKKYKKYANVKCVIHKENIGGTQNILTGLQMINTKYFAILDTDDYWSDENKLQMQVDILEKNADCSYCAHNTLVNYVHENKTKPFINSPTRKIAFPPKRISRKFYMEPHTSSRLYRTECLNLSEFKDPIIYTYDIANNFYFLTKGNLYYIDKIMSVYNYTTSGIYSGISSYEQRFKSATIINRLNAAFGYKFNNILARFFSTRLNLNLLKFWQLKYTKNPQKLDKLYIDVLESYKNIYLKNCETKPILKFVLPINKKSRLVLELKREKDRV